MHDREALLRLLAVSLLLYMLVSFGAVRLRLNAARVEEEALALACEALREENETLRRDLSAPWDDERLEALARERLGLVRPGEKIFYFN